MTSASRRTARPAGDSSRVRGQRAVRGRRPAPLPAPTRVATCRAAASSSCGCGERRRRLAARRPRASRRRIRATWATCRPTTSCTRPRPPRRVPAPPGCGPARSAALSARRARSTPTPSVSRSAWRCCRSACSAPLRQPRTRARARRARTFDAALFLDREPARADARQR